MANYYIQQSININMLRIDGISNSSVLQIGSAGIIKPASYLYNTGGFTGPAPQAGSVATQEGSPPAPVVPLQSPTAT
ncbi:spore germination protein GerPB [Mesobacillus maritimus]|jgi:spore germination protein PB|uniref:Spore germination protein GerPB n=1 Tax=Mesobacillus maritimus TaxID=1643336 RepID=A0ABS7JZ77_9BACI|nr:spore germination protein GerPB [Mesobacillus maritimus]MBY0095293.1 spore germination protein GerPB [Mesobacillus maritimus]